METGSGQMKRSGCLDRASRMEDFPQPTLHERGKGEGREVIGKKDNNNKKPVIANTGSEDR